MKHTDYLKKKKNREIRRRIVSILSALVVFVATYALVLPALTLDVKTARMEPGMSVQQSADPEAISAPEDSGEDEAVEEKSAREEESVEAETSEKDEESVKEEDEKEDQSSKGEDQASEEESSYKKADTEKADAEKKEDAVQTDEADAAEDEGSEQESSSKDADSEKALDQSGSEESEVESADAFKVPELEAVDFDEILTDKTDFYYYHEEISEEDSSADASEKAAVTSTDIQDWKKVKEDTILAPEDFVRVYLSYTIPAGALNETNTVARYRLPDGLELTDKQIKAINKNENGISGKDEDAEDYKKYLGAEAIEGTRTPDRILKEGTEEFISATVKAEKVYKNDKYVGQDLVFTFAPYTVRKNQISYDEKGTVKSEGKTIKGWFTFDLTPSHIGFEEIEQVSAVDGEDGTDSEADSELIRSRAKITFVKENEKKDIDEISRELTLEVPADTLTDSDKEKEDIDSQEEQDAAQTAEQKTLTYEGADYTVVINYTEDAQIPDNAELTVSEIEKGTDEYNEYLEQAKGAVDEDKTVNEARFFDITILADGEEVEPQAPVSVQIIFTGIEQTNTDDTQLLHYKNDKEVEVMDQAEFSKSEEPENETKAVDTVQFETDGFSVYGIVGTETITTKVITASGETYEISVTYGADAEVPNGASLKAEEILEGGEEYESYYEKTLMVLQEQATDENYLAGLDFARFFDVTIYDSEGTKIEPKAPVEVKITYVDPLEVADHAELKVVHFADQGTEIIDIDNQEQSVSEIVYEQSGFSVIGTIGATDAYGWPQGDVNPYVLILQSGDKYYAVAHDGSLKEVHYLNETVSFMGQETTTLDYLDDYLWDYTVVSNTRHTARLSTYGEDTTTYIDPTFGVIPGNPNILISTAQRTLNISEGKVYANYYGTSYSISAEGGNLHRTELSDDTTSPILFAPKSSFIANSSESDSYDFIDIDALINQWKKQMTQDLVVDKTAEVFDYENRIYQVDLAASSGYHIIDPSLALEFVVDASRSMFFPENLYEQGTYSNIQGLRSWITTDGDPSQVYYIITDPNGAATNWAVYYNTNRNAWYIVDASNHEAPDGNNSEGYALSNWSSNAGYEGKIYISDEKVAGQPWNRLDYMRLAVDAAARVLYAVDPSAQIGLVSFNSARTSGTNQHPATFAYGPFTADRINELEDSLYNISLDGGTNHQAGLERAYTEFTTNFVNIKNCQTTVVLITDGAPNASGVTWDTIARAANTLKAMTNNYGQHTGLYTLGLSIGHIGTNAQQLANISTDPATCAFNAEKSTEVVNCITKIIEAVVIDANLKGNVTDVIDPAFYPVNPYTGKPVESGTWITAEGEVVAAESEDAVGQIVYEGGEWKVFWNNQIINWPTYTDSTKTEIQTHGWNGRVYVKSQEDFLGGNDVNTNTEGSKAEALQYENPRTHALVDISSDDAEKIKEFDTPYVNVDELAINENSTEWTVYLGESVDPRTELEELLDKVQIYEVVKEDGSLVYTLNQGSTTNPTNKATTGVTIDLDTILGTLNGQQWDALIDGDPIETEYKAYGHTPGSIWVTLTQEVVTGEDDLTHSPHNTTVVGEQVEKYTLTVTYEPYDSSVADYHTGNNITGSHGADTDEMVSENVHIINVFAKGMQITKTDELFDKELTGAKFVLYRTARDGDDALKVTTIEGASGNYYPVAELDLSSSAVGTIDPIKKLASGEQYYLVETESPDGYNLLDHPLPVTLTITESFVPKPGTNSQNTKPDGIYDWIQTAVLTLGSDRNVKRTDEDNLQDLTHVAIIADSENAILYFRIANNPGFILPNTGGPGILLYTLSGLTLIFAAALMYGFRMRRRERRLK